MKLEAYRVISDVFPTDWSPSRTIFVRLSGEDEKSAVVGVAVLDMVYDQWEQSGTCPR